LHYVDVVEQHIYHCIHGQITHSAVIVIQHEAIWSIKQPQRIERANIYKDKTLSWKHVLFTVCNAPDPMVSHK